MIPNKIMWYLGYNNLGLILEQERKHWLMKTDKMKQVQDKNTGDIFQGIMDNMGSDIVIEASKLPIKNDIVPTISFVDTGSNSIFDIDYAAFPFSIGAKGLLFSRITSINYPIETSDELQYKNYKIVFRQAKTTTMLFGVSPYTSDVYSGQWLETTVPPTLLMMDDNGEYTITIDLRFKNLSNVKYYYPLEEGLQPFVIENTSYQTYTSETINDDGYIGYPLFWFSSGETQTGPSVTTNDTTGVNSKGLRYMYFSNEGNSQSRYNAKAYVNVDGSDAFGATPDATLPENYEIRCSCYDTDTFTNSESDFFKEINISSISFYNKNDGVLTQIPIEIGEGESNIFKMTKDVGWAYVDEHTYKVDMSEFLSNNESQSGLKSPLISIFDLSLDSSIPFYTEQKKDLGAAGIRMSAANPVSDIYERYPHDLDKWEGLPTWFTEFPETGCPQHLAVYTIHNTPVYSESTPDSRQVAALLFDPGKMKITDDEELTNDEKGRIYVISNDDPEYVNNANAKYPKPERTVARICDIPTSVSDFLDVDGLIPVSVVDPDYVRSEASFTTEQKEMLWNRLSSRIVTPESEDENGNPFYASTGYTREPYKYIWYDTKNLNNVDLIGHNNFREWVNLNPVVDPKNVSVVSIVDGGTGYVENSTGIIVIGGVSIDYVVNEVDRDGKVLDVSVYPQDKDQTINLSNFNMDEGNTGRTKVYGTMSKPRNVDGEIIPKVGEGLKVILKIENFADIRTRQGDIYDDLVAFVYEDDAIRMYKYIKGKGQYGSDGVWMSYLKISDFQKTTSIKDQGGYSVTDALTRSIIPYFNQVNVCYEDDGKELTPIDAVVTPSFINIIDKKHTPLNTVGDNSGLLKHVDLCKFHCDKLSDWITASNKTDSSVIEAISSLVNLDRDCYIIWRWRNPNDSYDRTFQYGIVRRSLNNYVTTDTTTTIPKNNLKYDSYINTNAGTTVVWDVPDFGPMMWVYNPEYKKHEIYSIDQETRDIYISFTNEEKQSNTNLMSWADVDIRISEFGREIVYVVDPEKGTMNFNVFTNNPVQSNKDISKSFITEKEFVKIVSQGDDASSVKFNPIGNWQLVYPRLNQYKIVSDSIQTGVYNSEVKLRRLVPLKGESLGNVQNVLDSTGHNINSKVVLFDEGVTGTKMKIFNSQTGKFETV